MSQNSLEYFLGRMLDRVATQIPLVNTSYSTTDECMTVTDNGYHLEYPIPGMTKQNVQVKLDGNELLITAKKENNTSKTLCSLYKYSNTLPNDADLKTIKARVENGVLYIDVDFKVVKNDEGIVNIDID